MLGFKVDSTTILFYCSNYLTLLCQLVFLCFTIGGGEILSISRVAGFVACV